jgi:hypothetical protein
MLVEPGETVAGLNAEFLAQVRQFDLQYRCDACVYFWPSQRACTLGWPVEGLLAEPVVMLDDKGEPAFCKAFEPAGS